MDLPRRAGPSWKDLIAEIKISHAPVTAICHPSRASFCSVEEYQRTASIRDRLYFFLTLLSSSSCSGLSDFLAGCNLPEIMALFLVQYHNAAGIHCWIWQILPDRLSSDILTAHLLPPLTRWTPGRIPGISAHKNLFQINILHAIIYAVLSSYHFLLSRERSLYEQSA